MARSRAYQYIEAASAVEVLSTTVDTPPSREAQVRPLTRLPRAEQPSRVGARPRNRERRRGASTVASRRAGGPRNQAAQRRQASRGRGEQNGRGGTPVRGAFGVDDAVRIPERPTIIPYGIILGARDVLRHAGLLRSARIRYALLRPSLVEPPLAERRRVSASGRTACV